MNAISYFGWFVFVIGITPLAVAGEGACSPQPRTVCYQRACVADESQPSWIFRRGTYTHDPATGARVAQYMRTPPVEPLEDERNVTSRYRRITTNLRGTNGSQDTTYEVQAWGNGRGGLDAEWERFHSAWKESYLQGGYSNGPVWNNGWNGGWNNGWNGPWNNGWGGNGGWGQGWGPGNGPGNWGPNGPGPNHGGPNGNHHGNGGTN
jgi:hypothetical protein